MKIKGKASIVINVNNRHPERCGEYCFQSPYEPRCVVYQKKLNTIKNDGITMFELRCDQCLQDFPLINEAKND